MTHRASVVYWTPTGVLTDTWRRWRALRSLSENNTGPNGRPVRICIFLTDKEAEYVDRARKVLEHNRRNFALLAVNRLCRQVIDVKASEIESRDEGERN